MESEGMTDAWGFFEKIYDSTVRKGETFSSEMGDVIRRELEKMKSQMDEWKKSSHEDENGYICEEGKKG